MGFVMINTYLQFYETGHSIAEFMVVTMENFRKCIEKNNSLERYNYF